MTRIDSKIADIRRLMFKPMPGGKAVPVVKIATSERAIVALGADGCLYTNQVSANLFFQLTSTSLDSAFKACVKLGVLSGSVVAEHTAHRNAVRKVAQDASLARAILEDAKTLGLALGKRQAAKLQRLVDLERAAEP